MIKIDFSSAISIYLCLSIFLVFILWIFYNYRRDGILNETKYLQQCPYCTYMFFNYALETSPKVQDIKKSGVDASEENPNLISAEISQDENLGNLKSNALVCPRCSSYIDL